MSVRVVHHKRERKEAGAIAPAAATPAATSSVASTAFAAPVFVPVQVSPRVTYSAVAVSVGVFLCRGSSFPLCDVTGELEAIPLQPATEGGLGFFHPIPLRGVPPKYVLSVKCRYGCVLLVASSGTTRFVCLLFGSKTFRLYGQIFIAAVQVESTAQLSPTYYTSVNHATPGCSRNDSVWLCWGARQEYKLGMLRTFGSVTTLPRRVPPRCRRRRSRAWARTRGVPSATPLRC